MYTYLTQNNLLEVVSNPIIEELIQELHDVTENTIGNKGDVYLAIANFMIDKINKDLAMEEKFSLACFAGFVMMAVEQFRLQNKILEYITTVNLMNMETDGKEN